MAFIAIDEASGRMLGVVRLHDDTSGKNGEFAILVRSRLKGHGLGWLLMKHMIAYAKEKGLETVRGQVLAENSTMLTMCAELGFHATDDPDETRREAGDAAARRSAGAGALRLLSFRGASEASESAIHNRSAAEIDSGSGPSGRPGMTSYGSTHCATRPRARASTTPSARSASSVAACTASRWAAASPSSNGASGPISPSISAPTIAGAATRAS